MLQVTINGETHDVDVEPDTPLLWVLRDNLGLTGTKYSCGIGVCGACTVFLGEEAVRSCVVPASMVVGRKVTTIEALGASALHPVQQAWIRHQVPQCGYCQSGMIMATAALLAHNSRPSDAEIDAALTNLCRCGTYERVRKAIRALVVGKET